METDRISAIHPLLCRLGFVLGLLLAVAATPAAHYPKAQHPIQESLPALAYLYAYTGIQGFNHQLYNILRVRFHIIGNMRI